ncbi:MAG: hypothetical protein AAGF29_03395, partial [Pseudomonadota bacterium]
LVVLSATLAIIWLWSTWCLAKDRALWQRLVISLVAFALFDWLTPQIYYFYYLAAIGDLPLQVVIDLPPTPMDLLRLLTFSERSNLSFHSRGLLGWVLIAIALMQSRRRPV